MFWRDMDYIIIRIFKKNIQLFVGVVQNVKENPSDNKFYDKELNKYDNKKNIFLPLDKVILILLFAEK